MLNVCVCTAIAVCSMGHRACVCSRWPVSLGRSRWGTCRSSSSLWRRNSSPSLTPFWEFTLAWVTLHSCCVSLQVYLFILRLLSFFLSPTVWRVHVQPYPDPGPAALPAGWGGQSETGGQRECTSGLKLLSHCVLVHELCSYSSHPLSRSPDIFCVFWMLRVSV